MTKKIGIYPGTFDPITKGHAHIIKRASKLVDELIVTVADNSSKHPFFTQQERLALVRAEVEILNERMDCHIRTDTFDRLLVDYAQSKGAVCIFRGLRAVSDFDYEFQMTGMNIYLAPDIETVFLMAADEWQFVSSSFVKEVHRLGGDISRFVSPNVLKALDNKTL